ncbi:MAG TPA: flagellar M-ring protein FliF C-terminal domain-containing protein [Phycisphaerae bacterium]|nr:flagellar M-ring protein FliF C-terminal domain-containing protein [Phycisphaerae bacterium]
MEFLRKLFVQTQQHLKGLTVSQRLAIGSCVALIALSLLWVMNWAGSPVMVPLLDQSISGEELTAIQNKLDSLGVKYTIVGDRVMVSVADQYRVRGQLAEAQLLPRDMTLGFAKLIEKNSSPWLNMAEQDRRWGLALSNELSQVLCGFNGVADAKVFIDKTTKRMIGQPPVTPTASVFIRPKAGVTPTAAQFAAMANMVSAAVGGLDPTNVKVADMVTGRSFTMPSEEDAGLLDDLSDRRAKEEYFANKLRSLLAPHVPGILVEVHAKLDAEATQTVEEKHGKPVILTDKSETETSNRGRSAEEPGVNPNTSVAIAPGGNPESTERTKAETVFDGKVDKTITRTDKPRHVIRELFASVNVPRSYLSAIFKSIHGKDPSDLDLEKFATPELAKIKKQVMSLLAMTGEQDEEKRVQVDWFHDDVSAQVGGQAAQAGGDDGMMQFVRAHGGKAGLGALAAFSLLMMLMLVRRVAEGPVLPGEQPPSPQLIRVRSGRKRGGEVVDMTFGEEVVGEAEASDALLFGREVDEQTLHARKVIDQVVELVKEDPEASVNILRRWMEPDKK